MRYLPLILLIACTEPLVSVSLFHSGSPVEVMPMGDSITAAPGPGGYRAFLYDLLTASGVSFDFVGTQSSGNDPTPDNDCEGHPGYRILDLSVESYWPASFTPGRTHVVLLHAGTNDVLNGTRPLEAALRMQVLLERIQVIDSGAVVLLAQVLPVGGQYASRNWLLHDYNYSLVAAAGYMDVAGQDVTLVDVNTGYQGGFDPDGTHPDLVGAAWMADRWYEAFSARFP